MRRSRPLTTWGRRGLTRRCTRRTPVVARFTVRSAPAGDHSVFGTRPPLQRLALCYDDLRRSRVNAVPLDGQQCAVQRGEAGAIRGASAVMPPPVCAWRRPAPLEVQNVSCPPTKDRHYRAVEHDNEVADRSRSVPRALPCMLAAVRTAAPACRTFKTEMPESSSIVRRRPETNGRYRRAGGDRPDLGLGRKTQGALRHVRGAQRRERRLL